MTLQIDRSVKSPNHNARPRGVTPSSLVLHTTEGAFPSDLKWLCNPQTSGKYEPVSCHYVISPKNYVYQIVPDDRRAWHAGTGSYLGITDWNSISIGIEISHQSGHPYPAGQLDVTADLCRMLIEKYSIAQNRIVAHRWIAPERRNDPTDFSDVGLAAWIAGLYEVDYAAAWGRPDYHAEFGIETAWRPHYKELGQALTDELLLVDGRVVRIFQHGAVVWSQAHTEVWR